MVAQDVSLGASEAVGNHRDGHAAHEHLAGGGVPEIVKAQTCDSGPSGVAVPGM